MIYGSVCSGIESASVAWNSLGWKCAFVSEIEPFPNAVLSHHYPDVPNAGDFTKIQEGMYEKIDLLVGGTPCQDFSIAGLRKGITGERGNLTLEFVKLAQRIRPEWIVWENVPGVLSSDGGRAFGAFLGALEELGYGFAYRILDAQFAGVPQRRRRVFVVGHLGDFEGPRQVLFESEGLSGDTKASRVSKSQVARCLKARTPGQSHDYSLETYIPVSIQGTVIGRKDHNGPRGPGYLNDGSMFTLTATDRHAVAFAQNQLGEVRTSDVVGTLNTNSNASGRNTPLICATLMSSGAGMARPAGMPAEADCLVQEQLEVRRLTPIECERLQGFPDNYTNVLYRGKPASDGPRYKAIGNSMCVNVMRKIGERIQKYINEEV